MKHRYAKPNTLIAEFVRTVLVMEGSLEADSNSLPLVTKGMPTLFCRLKKGDVNEVTQLALFTNSPDDFWMVDEQTTIIAYFFKPFVVPGLFNVPAAELSEPIDLSIWNPHKCMALKTQLIYATDTLKAIEALDNLLVLQFKEEQVTYKIVQYATNQIMKDPRKEVLSEILKALNLNDRTFQRIFKKFVGVTPTRFRRICQFQQSFGQLRQKEFDHITEVAYENGFADQSHFIRSFREFTQTTPKDYLKKGLKKL